MSHLKDNVAKLLFKYHNQPWAEQAITQIECRQKAASKIKNLLSNEAFMFPHRLSAEQCTAQIVADFHSDLATFADTVLDMTAGLGVDALTQARHRKVTAIDINHNAAHSLIHNAAILGLNDSIDVLCCNSVEWIRNNSHREFDLVFIDPARRDSSGGRLKALKDCEPDVTDILPDMLRIGRKIFIKASPMLDVDQTIRDINTATKPFGSVNQIYSVGTSTECKEILAVVDRDMHAKPQITAVTLFNDRRLTYTAEDTTSPSLASTINEDMWLYEPYPAAMKIANTLSFGPTLSRLDKDTHLYISENYEDGYPCKAMKILRVLPFNDKNTKAMGREFPIANVAARNFTLSAPELSKRLKVKDGGTVKIFGVKALGRNMLIAAQEMQK